MFALTNTLGSRSSLVCGQPIRAHGTTRHSRRMVAKIVCEDEPEKKSAKKVKAAGLRYGNTRNIRGNVVCGSRRTAHASSIPGCCVLRPIYPCLKLHFHF